jgi:hypothetical protein
MNWSETGGALMETKPSAREPIAGNQKYTGIGTAYYLKKRGELPNIIMRLASAGPPRFCGGPAKTRY